MKRKWSQRNLVIVPAVVILALAMIAAIVVVVAVTGPDQPDETTDTVIVQPRHSLTFPESMPADFGLVAEWGVARMNTLDTFSGTFTKDLVSGSPPTATTGLVLTPAELRGLFDGLRELELWSYPRHFHPWYADVTSAGVEQMVTPATNYHLRVVAAGLEQEIWWTDDNASTVASAEALRDWFRMVMELVQSRPEYKALPQARGGYA